MISDLLAQNLMDSGLLREGHTRWCLIAVSIYMASHLAGAPRSPREIRAVTHVEADHIRLTYDRIYQDRGQLADDDVLAFLEFAYDEVDLLNWPAPGNELTDEQIESNNAAQMLKRSCEQGCDDLGLDDRAAEVSLKLAKSLFAARFMIHWAPFLREITAVGIFMASHLVRRPVALIRVAEAVGTTETLVLSAYETVYVNRYQLAEEMRLSREDMERLLQRLPSL